MTTMMVMNVDVDNDADNYDYDNDNTSSTTSDEGIITEGDTHDCDNGEDACALMATTSAHRQRQRHSQL